MTDGDKDAKRLEHMLGAAERATRFAGTGLDAFVASELVQSAVIHQLLILGEAAKAVNRETRERFADLPWREMMRMRDVLIHHYHGVRLDIVWGVVRDELPVLLVELPDIIASATANRS